MKKKEYCEAEIDIILLASADIITTSIPGEDDGDDGPLDNNHVIEKDGWA